MLQMRGTTSSTVGRTQLMSSNSVAMSLHRKISVSTGIKSLLLRVQLSK